MLAAGSGLAEAPRHLEVAEPTWRRRRRNAGAGPASLVAPPAVVHACRRQVSQQVRGARAVSAAIHLPGIGRPRSESGPGRAPARRRCRPPDRASFRIFRERPGSGANASTALLIAMAASGLPRHGTGRRGSVRHHGCCRGFEIVDVVRTLDHGQSQEGDASAGAGRGAYVAEQVGDKVTDGKPYRKVAKPPEALFYSW